MVVPVFKELISKQMGLIQDSYKYHKTIEGHIMPKRHREVSKEGKIVWGQKSDIEGPLRIKIIGVDNILSYCGVH